MNISDESSFDEGEIARLLATEMTPPEPTEYDESAADDVKMCTCAKCGYAWPA